MSILKLKLIGAASLLLGAVACEPLPVYPPNQGPRPPYGSEQNSNIPNYNTPNYNSPYSTQPTPPPVPSRDQYPIAERTDNPSRVLSPYPPYNVIDVQGFRSGQLAKDPSNGKIFRVP